MKRVGGLFLLLFSLILSAAAQDTSGILQGIVTDENKAIIPEAKIVLRDEKGARRETVSDANGNFSFENLAFGKYKLTVEKEGFAVQEKEIALGATNQTSDLTLSAGAVSANVMIVMDGAEIAVESTLKLSGSIRETPRSITVVGEQRIREQNFRQVPDVLNYVPGTTQNSYRNGSYHFYSRGYRMSSDDTRLDGFAGINVGSGGFGASLFGVEEVVILRGPAGLIYGSSTAPGGFINLISKRPEANRFTQIDLSGGGFSGNGVSFAERPSFAIDFDTTGAFTKNERILYRGLFTFENTNYFTADTRDRNIYANASVAFKLDKDGRYILTPRVQMTRYNRPYGGGIVISPTTSLRTNDGLRTINEDDLSPLDVNLFGGRRVEKTSWVGLNFAGVVTEKIRVNAAYRYVSFDTDINQFAPQVTSNAQINQLINQKIVSRIQAKSLTGRKYNNFNADASYEWLNNSWWKNTTQIGFYNRVLDSRTAATIGAIPAAQSPINIYTGQSASPLQDTFPAIAFGAWTRDIVWNSFLQNRTSLANGRVSVMFGINYGQNNPAFGTIRKSGLIPNASVVFNATPQISFYASYATSFNPTDPDLEDAQGNRGTFAPTLGKNYEIGAKFDFLNRRLALNFALFQNQIDNALVQSDVNILNPWGNRFYVPAGTRRSRGAELSGDFAARQDLRFSFGISYLDAIYRGFPATTTAVSSPLPNSRAEKSPRWSYSLYSRYERREGYLKGFGAGIGLTWQGSRVGSNGATTFAAPDPLILPSFMRFDTALFYRLNKNVNFAVNVENLFDELIFISASVGSSIEIAAPRTITFRTSFNF